MFAGGSAQTIMGILTGEVSRFKYDPTGVAAMLYLILIGSLVGYTSYIYLISVWPISKAGTYAYVNPVVAMFLGWLILHEQIRINNIISAALILTGVLIVQKAKVIVETNESTNNIKAE